MKHGLLFFIVFSFFISCADLPIRTRRQGVDAKEPPSRQAVAELLSQGSERDTKPGSSGGVSQSSGASVTEPLQTSDRETSPALSPANVSSVEAPWFERILEIYHSPASDSEKAQQISAELDSAHKSSGLNISQMAKELLGREPRAADYFDYWLIQKLWAQGEYAKAAQFAKPLINSASPTVRQSAQYLHDQYLAQQSANRQKIGLIVPVANRKDIQGALEMALGITGSNSPYQLYVENEPESEEEYRKSVEKLVRQERVISIFGGLRNKSRSWIVRASQEYEVPFIYLGQKSLVTKESPWILQAGQSLEHQMRWLAKAAYDQGARRLAIIYPNDLYGTEAATVFWNEWLALGGRVTQAETYHPKENDFQSLIAKMTKKDPAALAKRQLEYKKIIQQKLEQFPQRRREILSQGPVAMLPAQVDFDAVFIPDTVMGMSKILSTLAFYGVKHIPVYGTSLWFSPEMKKYAGPLWAGHVQVAVSSHALLPYVNQAIPFLQDYQLRTGQLPSVYAMWTFESGLVVRDLLLRKAPESRRELLDLLKSSSLSGLRGVLGQDLYFDEFGEMNHPLKILRWSRGEKFELSL
jgi:ABC-type branched-subunit amino acid transport system substrate-binding protein